MFSRNAATYLVPRRRRLASGIVLGRRFDDRFPERLAAIAIICVLAVSALKAYRIALEKVRLVEAASVMQDYRNSAHETLAVNGRLPDEIPASEGSRTYVGRYFEASGWRDREIVLELEHELAGRVADASASADAAPTTLSFRVARTPTGDRQIFLCGLADPPDGFEADQPLHTNVAREFLPFFCRS